MAEWIDVDNKLPDEKMNCLVHYVHSYSNNDGFYAFVLFEKECIFDFNKIPEKNNIAKYIETSDKDEEVFITNKRFISGDTTLVKLQGETYTVYANEKYVKIFREYHLFADDNNSRIVAKNDFGMAIGMFCPMRYFEES